MSVPDNVYRAAPCPGAVSTLKWISVRLALPVVICGTIAVALQTTIAEGPKLAAADMTPLASMAPEAVLDATADVAADVAEPVARPRQVATPGGPGNARHEAAAAMLLLLVATAKKRDGGEAHRQAAAADLPSGNQTADARHFR